MMTTNLEDQDERILIAAIGEDGLYEKVKHTLLNLFREGGKTQKKRRRRFG